jgi:precorrin-3B C(17)-methyltransferase
MSKNGKIYVVGIGPGKKPDMTFKAYEAMENSDIIVGYKTYTDLVKKYFPNTEIRSSSMMKEVDRCIEVLELAKAGKNVALISSGDAGVYGMAGIMYEVIGENNDVEVEVIAGVTATNAAAAIVGAPIMHDYVTISLSNLLTDWELIKRRLELAAQGDFIVSLYNPKSRGRTTQIAEAQQIMLKYKSKDTPVAIVRNAGRENEEYEITTLENMLDFEINMLTIVLIGNSNTYVKNGKMITPRGYEKKYEY